MATWRKQLSMPGLLAMVSKTFSKVKDPQSRGRSRMAIADCLKAGLAIFGLKYPSLLQFDQAAKDDEAVKHNLQTLYGLEQVPCDTYLRERLDEVNPKELRKPFNAIFAAVQRGKGLEVFRYLDDHYLLSLDGTGFFSSPTVHCQHCCVKERRDGSLSYYHQMLGAVLVHPDHGHVIPLAPEPILKADGDKKNDCERNAAKRLLTTIRREHPHLPLIVVEDGLASNGPHINLLQSLNMHFILGAKPDDHTFLFNWVDTSKGVEHHEMVDKEGTTHRFRYLSGVPLNDSHFDCEVNFLEYWEITKEGEQKCHFSWVTDLPLTGKTVYKVMRGGRARWRVENETFNTLKNQGYHFEHNFGHGNKHLSTVFAYLMFLAFLIDQVLALCCGLFKQAVKAAKRPLYFWNKVRGIFFHYLVESWGDLYKAIIRPPPRHTLVVGATLP